MPLCRRHSSRSGLPDLSDPPDLLQVRDPDVAVYGSLKKEHTVIVGADCRRHTKVVAPPSDLFDEAGLTIEQHDPVTSRQPNQSPMIVQPNRGTHAGDDGRKRA